MRYLDLLRPCACMFLCLFVFMFLKGRSYEIAHPFFMYWKQLNDEKLSDKSPSFKKRKSKRRELAAAAKQIHSSWLK